MLPRTNSFGLDYLQYVNLCPSNTPPGFLRLTFYCCIVSIHSNSICQVSRIYSITIYFLILLTHHTVWSTKSTDIRRNNVQIGNAARQIGRRKCAEIIVRNSRCEKQHQIGQMLLNRSLLFVMVDEFSEDITRFGHERAQRHRRTAQKWPSEQASSSSTIVVREYHSVSGSHDAQW